MSKYIDADLLRKEIEFAKTVYDNPNRVVHGVADAFRQDGRAAMCDDILKKIDSLQQEQPEDPWQRARIAARTLNKMDLGIKFYGNLFPYLRKRGKLEGYCMKGTIGKKQPVWLYDTEGIAFLVKNGMLNYSPKN